MQPNQPYTEPPKENAAAIASLVLGVVSVIGMGPITGIPAIITGIIGMKNPHNKGLAVAGLVTGIISTVVVVLALIAFILMIIFIAATAPAVENAANQQKDVPFSNQQRI